MYEFIRPKPLCLITISGLSIDDLSTKDTKINNFRNLIDNYPFLVLNSSKKNINQAHNFYIELGSGNDINVESDISLAQIISDAGLNQLHLANTESYAYVSYFFNNRNKKKHKNEVWQKVKKLEFDDKFKNNKLTKTLIKEINKQYYDFIFIDYNNLLMNLNRSKALADLDKQIGNVIDLVLSYNGALLITANSGLENIDNRVPLFLISKFWKNKSFIDFNYQKKINEQDVHGNIFQIAATILKILGISKPQKMKSNSLI